MKSYLLAPLIGRERECKKRGGKPVKVTCPSKMAPLVVIESIDEVYIHTKNQFGYKAMIILGNNWEIMHWQYEESSEEFVNLF